MSLRSSPLRSVRGGHFGSGSSSAAGGAAMVKSPSSGGGGGGTAVVAIPRPFLLVSHLFVAIAAFNGGLLIGMNTNREYKNSDGGEFRLTSLSEQEKNNPILSATQPSASSAMTLIHPRQSPLVRATSAIPAEAPIVGQHAKIKTQNAHTATNTNRRFDISPYRQDPVAAMRKKRREMAGGGSAGNGKNTAPSTPPSPSPQPPPPPSIASPSSLSSFPGTGLRRMFASGGIATVNRDDFASTYDVGVPLDPSTSGNEDVVILYSSTGSLPADHRGSVDVGGGIGSQREVPRHYESAAKATANCNVMKVVLIEPDTDKEGHCIAVMGQWESYHLHKFMRLPLEADYSDVAWNNSKVLSPEIPLRYVSRSRKGNGVGVDLPRRYDTQSYWLTLVDYLSKLDDTLKRLRPVVREAAIRASGRTKTIIAMVCNWGQSELFVNFVCSARSRGLDLSNVLLFATDRKTYELAQSLGVHAFDVRGGFGEMPEAAAKHYGDNHFTSLMLSKSYVGHLVSSLGYDMLFQDVDVLWYRNPLEFFDFPTTSASKMKNTADPQYDIYFQDDGSRSERFAPYSPNTGFYFMRHNERTEYLMSVLVRMGDHVLATSSHQEVLTSLLSEHASLNGLRVKVFERDSAEGRNFPGGFHYHRRTQFMKEMMASNYNNDKEQQQQQKPYIFHMSWTRSKDNKKRFFQQMGEWFVHPQCGTSLNSTASTTSTQTEPIYPDPVLKKCCLAEPIVDCHYRDKPSKVPCRDNPPIDEGKPSFW